MWFWGPSFPSSTFSPQELFLPPPTPPSPLQSSLTTAKKKKEKTEAVSCCPFQFFFCLSYFSQHFFFLFVVSPRRDDRSLKEKRGPSLAVLIRRFRQQKKVSLSLSLSSCAPVFEGGSVITGCANGELSKGEANVSLAGTLFVKYVRSSMCRHCFDEGRGSNLSSFLAICSLHLVPTAHKYVRRLFFLGRHDSCFPFFPPLLTCAHAD